MTKIQTRSFKTPIHEPLPSTVIYTVYGNTFTHQSQFNQLTPEMSINFDHGGKIKFSLCFLTMESNFKNVATVTCFSVSLLSQAKYSVYEFKCIVTVFLHTHIHSCVSMCTVPYPKNMAPPKATVYCNSNTEWSAHGLWTWLKVVDLRWRSVQPF